MTGTASRGHLVITRNCDYDEIVASGVHRRRASHLVNGMAVPASPGADALEALLEVGAEIQSETLRVDAVLELIVERAQQLSGAEMAWLILPEEHGDQLSVRVVRGNRTEAMAHAQVTVGRGVGGVAVKDGRTVVVHDYPHYVHDTPESTRSVIEGEGIISLICAPMMRGASMVGALYVGNRRKTPFRPTKVAMLSALANHASIAIENRRLYQQLEQKNQLLEQSFASHRCLTLAAVAGRGIEHIGDTLASQLARSIVIRQNIVAPFAAAHGGERSAGDLAQDRPARSEYVRPIIAAGEEVGTIAVVGEAPLSKRQMMTLDHGAAVLALELLKERAAQDVEWRLRGELLEELLDLRGEPPERLVSRAERVGIDLSRPFRIMTIEAKEVGAGTLAGLVRATIAAAIENRTEVLTAQRGSRVIVALPATRECARRLAEMIIRAGAARGMPALVGISPPSRDFVRAFRGSIACLSLMAGVHADKALLDYDELGPLRFLLDAPDIEHSIDVVLERLNPLLDHDLERHSALVPTLRAYVECDGSIVRAADRCFIHVSTMKYRLRQIREILGTAPSDSELKFELRLAFRVLDLLEALGTELPAPCRRGSPAEASG